MHLNSRQNSWRAAVLLLAIAAGCNEYINPWQDETAGPEAVTTASVEGARAYQADELMRDRGYEPTVAMAQDGTVRHFPLWWEDPFVDRGSNDGEFRWTWEDYFAMPYSLGRFDLNTLAIPVSAVVQPPVPLMASDGVTSRQALGFDHDAHWEPASRTSTPPDILEIGATPEQGSEMTQ